jgi:uroporphyrinogen-III synthase
MRILYLGLDPSRFPCKGELLHVPLIQTTVRPFEGKVKEAFERLQEYTHVILTSRTAASSYLQYASDPQNKTYLSVGRATTQLLEEHGINVHYTANPQTAEGIIEILEQLDLKKNHLFFPKSSSARAVIAEYCLKTQIKLTTLDLYDTKPSEVPLPDLTLFDQIVFTSPSIVHAFFAKTNNSPPFEKCYPIGPVTEEALKEYF